MKTFPYAFVCSTCGVFIEGLNGIIHNKKCFKCNNFYHCYKCEEESMDDREFKEFLGLL